MIDPLSKAIKRRHPAVTHGMPSHLHTVSADAPSHQYVRRTTVVPSDLQYVRDPDAISSGGECFGVSHSRVTNAARAAGLKNRLQVAVHGPIGDVEEMVIQPDGLVCDDFVGDDDTCTVFAGEWRVLEFGRRVDSTMREVASIVSLIHRLRERVFVA